MFLTSRSARRTAAHQTLLSPVLGALGINPTHERADIVAWDDFAIVQPTPSIRRHATCTSGCRVLARRRRRLLARGRRGRLRGRRAARRASAIPARLLRRLPARPGREQRRGGPPRRHSPRRPCRPPVDRCPRPRRGGGVLRHGRAPHGAAAGPPLGKRAPVSGRLGDVFADRRRPSSDRAPAHRVPCARSHDGRGVPRGGDGGRVPKQRRAARAPAVRDGLLRRVRARPRRHQRRVGRPRRLVVV